MEKNQKRLEKIQNLSTLLDTQFKGPYGLRFGLDGVLGLIPGGDFFTSALSLYIVAEAAALGVSTSTLVRMALNIAIENLIDMIPIFGSFFDFYWKANRRNIMLIQNHIADPGHETIKSRMIIGLVAVFLLMLLVFSAYVSFKLLQFVIEQASSYMNT